MQTLWEVVALLVAALVVLQGVWGVLVGCPEPWLLASALLMRMLRACSEAQQHLLVPQLCPR